MTEPVLRETTGRTGEAENIPSHLARWISLTLRVGVGLSAALGVLGITRLLMGSTANFVTATTHGAALMGPAFVSGLAQGQGVDILLLAFLVLILTPLVRVVISAGLFASVHDRPFTALTLIVLLLLGASMMVGALT